MPFLSMADWGGSLRLPRNPFITRRTCTFGNYRTSAASAIAARDGGMPELLRIADRLLEDDVLFGPQPHGFGQRRAVDSGPHHGGEAF